MQYALYVRIFILSLRFLEYLDDVPDDHEERFHQDIAYVEKGYNTSDPEQCY